MAVEGCLYFLKSKCSGFVHYNAETEEITVGDPQFVSAIPQETNFGFIAKVVPTEHTICDDEAEDCPVEIRQELAAQLLGETSCGELIIATTPSCGEVPQDQQGDLANQVRFDKAQLADMGDVCADGFRVIAWYPSFRSVGGLQVPCKKFVSVPRLKMRKSQWSEVIKGSSDDLAGFSLILVPVAGGAGGDPCYELRMIEKPPKLPEGTNCGDSIYWDSEAEPPAWKTEARGLKFYPLSEFTKLGTWNNTHVDKAVVLPSFPTPPCAESPIFALFRSYARAHLGSSGSDTIFSIGLGSGYTHPGGEGGMDYENCIILAGNNGVTEATDALIRVTQASITLASDLVGDGYHQAGVGIMGYYY